MSGAKKGCKHSLLKSRDWEIDSFQFKVAIQQDPSKPQTGVVFSIHSCMVTEQHGKGVDDVSPQGSRGFMSVRKLMGHGSSYDTVRHTMAPNTKGWLH